MSHIERIRDICPVFAQVAQKYDQAIKFDRQIEAEQYFALMEIAAKAFWCGLEYGRSHASDLKSVKIPEGA